jgi:hypothetical protein
MMTVIHLIMLGFLTGVGLCALHYAGRRWAEQRDINCPWRRCVAMVGQAARLAGLGAGAYLLASVGWLALPAAATGFLVTRPALATQRATRLGATRKGEAG